MSLYRSLLLPGSVIGSLSPPRLSHPTSLQHLLNLQYHTCSSCHNIHQRAKRYNTSRYYSQFHKNGPRLMKSFDWGMDFSKFSPGNSRLLERTVEWKGLRREVSTLTRILQASPAGMQPYLNLIRFDKPIGGWLLYIPCLWSIALASPPGTLPAPTMIAMFGAGSFLMRSAGCIVNDMADQDFDGKVERTKTRPLASGELTNLQALTCLAGLLSLSLAILLQFNWYSVILGASSLSLVFVYPFMKRFTYWPQAVLGLTFNWGALLGYAAVAGACDWGVVGPLYGAGILWTLSYDTIYAHQDKEDDAIIGIKSTALKFGDRTKYWLTGFSSAMVACLSTAGVMSDQVWPYYLGVGAVASHLTWQIYSLDIDNPDDCGAKFRSNKNMGLAFFLAIVASAYLKTEDKSKRTEKVVDIESPEDSE